MFTFTGLDVKTHTVGGPVLEQGAGRVPVTLAIVPYLAGRSAIALRWAALRYRGGHAVGGETVGARVGKRRLIPLAGLAGAVAALAFLVVSPARPAPLMTMHSMAAMKTASSPTSGMSLRERFDYLALKHSNKCGLQPSTFASMAATARFQGACCGPMDARLYPEYVKQIHELAKYDHSVVPRDPYNMSVALARRLVAFNDTIILTRAQQQVYDNAFRYARDGAPCCCHCWRWTAFEGQAKFLIARRSYTARQIGTLWTLDDGCGDTSAGMVMTG